MFAVNHPPHTAHPVTGAEEKDEEGGPGRKAADSHSGGEVGLIYRASLMLGHHVKFTDVA